MYAIAIAFVHSTKSRPFFTKADENDQNKDESEESADVPWTVKSDHSPNERHVNATWKQCERNEIKSFQLWGIHEARWTSEIIRNI